LTILFGGRTTVLDLIALVIVVTAVLSYFNHRYIGLPTTIGVMGIALILSAALLGLNALGFSTLHVYEKSLLDSVNFSELLLQGMLSMLLFAGAMHVDLSELRAYRLPVILLAALGTILSTVVVGCGLWYLLSFTAIDMPLTFCLLFGALISPTDPIAVMGILKSVGAPDNLNTVITGESLFNDGVGIVLFALILDMATSGQTPTVSNSLMLLLREAGGGIAFGVVVGYVTYFMLKSINSYQEEVLITVAAVIGGYTLADHLHVSGPLAMVTVGLIIGNHGRALAMSDQTRQHVDMFWELIDGFLNSALFVLLGLEAVLIPFSSTMILPVVIAIVVTLAARLLTVGAPVGFLRTAFGLPVGSWQVLTWGGLRGGISVALALSIPSGPFHDTILTLTYVVVVFSILAQGLSMGWLVRKIVPCAS
jgi:CPA1 family monovalent cation:H+ antiporter